MGVMGGRGRGRLRDLDINGVAAVIAAIHGLTPAQRDVVVARIKHMRRLDFPHVGRVGRGHVTTFGFEDLLKVVMAFQLIEVGMPSFRAVDLVRSGWSRCAGALALAWRHLEYGDDRGAPMCVRPRATAAIGVAGDPQSRLETILVGGPFPTAGVGGSAIVMIDGAEVIRGLSSRAGIAQADLNAALIGIGARVFGSDVPHSWSASVIGDVDAPGATAVG